jgi:hypothetical protein
MVEQIVEKKRRKTWPAVHAWAHKRKTELTPGGLHVLGEDEEGADGGKEGDGTFQDEEPLVAVEAVLGELETSVLRSEWVSEKGWRSTRTSPTAMRPEKAPAPA